MSHISLEGWPSDKSDKFASFVVEIYGFVCSLERGDKLVRENDFLDTTFYTWLIHIYCSCSSRLGSHAGYR